MALFVSSDSIEIFPCGGRNSKYNVSSKLTTEYNLTSIINRLVDQDSFIVSVTGDNANPSAITFNLGGYLIGISDMSSLLSDAAKNGKYLVAFLVEESYDYSIDDGVTATFKQLKNLGATKAVTADNYAGWLDTNDEEFVGIGFGWVSWPSIRTSPITIQYGTGNYTVSGSSAPDVTKTQLPLLYYNGTSYTVPEDSYIKFKTDRMGKRSVTIDDGRL